MQLLHVTIGLAYCCWGLLSVIAQRNKKGQDKSRSWDLLKIIPNYKFFCPQPIRYDYHLYYRRQYADRSLTEWERVPVGKPKKQYSFLWNPTKKDKKVWYRLVKIIRLHYKDRPAKKPGHAYLLLLDYVKSHCPPQPGSRIQFRITYAQNLRPLPAEELFYLSPFHQHA